MELKDVETAEKEASEVLHSLLSVERLEKPIDSSTLKEIIVIQEGNNKVESRWNPEIHQQLYKNLEDDNYIVPNDVWEGTITIETDLEENEISVDEVVSSSQQLSVDVSEKKKPTKKKFPRKKCKKVSTLEEESPELDSNVQDIKARFQLGCDCNDDSCFKGLNPEAVYRHRLNIAELTKEEHDMYLMGLTMAFMSDPGETCKRRERKRLRASYCYHGRRVCLPAFLFLHNCTLYQMKVIRKHVTTHGVTPRVHGNHGKKPHNVFSLDIYRRATAFLKSYIQQHTTSTGNLKAPVLIPSEVSRKMIHNIYQEYVKDVAPPGEKILGYSTFRHFMKLQFPNIRFSKAESSIGASSHHASSASGKSAHGTHRSCSKAEGGAQPGAETEPAPQLQMAAIPVILSSEVKQDLSSPTYLVAPVQHYLQTQDQEVATFQPHTITLAPISNSGYTFNVATM